MRKYYEILGVSPTATSEEIREAWLFSVKAFHPDKFSSSSEHQKRTASERTQAINEAYDVLSDPQRRRQYDASRVVKAAPSSPPKPPQNPPKESSVNEDLIERCIQVIRHEKRASASLLMVRLRLGYTPAARVIAILEQRGILGPGPASSPREILVDLDQPIEQAGRGTERSSKGGATFQKMPSDNGAGSPPAESKAGQILGVILVLFSLVIFGIWFTNQTTEGSASRQNSIATPTPSPHPSR